MLGGATLQQTQKNLTKTLQINPVEQGCIP